MPTPPPLVAFGFTEGASASGSGAATPSVSWQTDDVVVVFGGTEGGTGGETMSTPTTTGSGLSFGTAQQLHNSTGSDSGLGCWAAVATANSSGTITVPATHASGTRHKFTGAYVWRGSAGIGNSAIATGSTPTVSMTPTGADGAPCWGVVDWNTDVVQSFTPSASSHNASTPGPTASPVAVRLNPNFTYYVAELDDQTSAGAVSYGLSTANTGPFTIIAIEVKAAAGGGATPVPAQPIVAPSLAAVQAGSW